jgi:hypothetical protein
VDAFVYENCSKGVDTHTEFCTGVPITSALGQIWTVDTTGAGSSPVFTFRRNQLRQFKADLPWNGNGTILRPGAEYQGAQHTQARAPHARSDRADGARTCVIVIGIVFFAIIYLWRCVHDHFVELLLCKFSAPVEQLIKVKFIGTIFREF